VCQSVTHDSATVEGIIGFWRGDVLGTDTLRSLVLIKGSVNAR